MEEELKRVEGWAGSVGGMAKEREQCVDIKEEVGKFKDSFLGSGRLLLNCLRLARRSCHSGERLTGRA